MNSKLFYSLFISMVISLVLACGSILAENSIKGHPASEISPGSFQEGTYSFPGRLGIGTTDPVNTLTVIHGQTGGISVGRSISNAGEGLYLTGSGYRNDDDWGAVTAGVYHDIGTYTARSTEASGIIFRNGNIELKGVTGLTPGTFRINFPTRVFIRGSDGHVGIGTTVPHGKLDIKQGHGDWISLSRTADSGYWHIHNPSSQERIEVGYTDNSGSTKWGMFVIKNTGNVGIGTTNPQAKLHVTGGAIKAEGGLIIETRRNDPSSPQTGRIWLRV